MTPPHSDCLEKSSYWSRWSVILSIIKIYQHLLNQNDSEGTELAYHYEVMAVLSATNKVKIKFFLILGTEFKNIPYFWIKS